MEDDSSFNRKAGRLARVIAFGVNNVWTILGALVLLVIFLAIFAILEIVFSPLKSFALAAFISVLACGVAFAWFAGASYEDPKPPSGT